MAQELKHIGRLRATGKKCIVVFRTLPGDAYTCLVVPTENLPDSYHDAMINLVESSGGQDAHEFGEVMARTNFPDGSIMLAALHSQQRMVAVPTKDVEMLPTTNTTIVLSELNMIIAEQRGVPIDEISIKPESKKKEEAAAPKPAAPSDAAKTTSASVNEVAPVEQTFATPEEEAKFYRSQADKLAKEAAAMRRKAEELSPTAKKK